MSVTGMIQNRAENPNINWKGIIYINRNRRDRTWYADRKQKGFLKIWLGVALPIMAFTAVAGFLLLGAFLTAFICLEQLRAKENAMQAADIFSTYETADWEKECAKWLQLDRFNIVAAVYDSKGNEIMHSNVETYESFGYRDSNVFSREIYGQMLSAIEQAKSEGTLAQGTMGIDPFDYHYRYDLTVITTAEGIYWLHFGSVSAPWLENHSDFIALICLILFMILLFTFLPAGYYYMLYRKRLEMERYYRNTAAALAHDLKTPLAAISGYAQNLRENVHTEKREYYAGAIIKNIDHMSTSIEDMLELARLQNVKVKLCRESVDPEELTKEILEPLQGILEEKELTVDIDGSMHIYADRALMKRALGNLISNAINYTPAGEKIRILSENGKFLIVNTGVLITNKKLKELKESFVKANEARGNQAGNGIGLTIVDEIMKLHGFKWRIESDVDRKEVKVSIDMGHNWNFCVKPDDTTRDCIV